MMIPTIHLNGTGKQTLLDELESAHAAMTTAIESLRQVTVHGRDYYVQGEFAYRQARLEMDVRLGALERVKEEIHEMYAKIQKQGK